LQRQAGGRSARGGRRAGRRVAGGHSAGVAGRVARGDWPRSVRCGPRSVEARAGHRNRSVAVGGRPVEGRRGPQSKKDRLAILGPAQIPSDGRGSSVEGRGPTQRNTKSQAPNTKEIPSSKSQWCPRRRRPWSLRIGTFLVLGAGCLVFSSWSLKSCAFRFKT